MIDDMWERVFVAAIGGMVPDPDLSKEDVVRLACGVANLAEAVYHASRADAPGEVCISESR